MYAEILVGAFLADTPERAARRRARLDALADRVPIVEFDRQVAADQRHFRSVPGLRVETLPA